MDIRGFIVIDILDVAFNFLNKESGSGASSFLSILDEFVIELCGQINNQ